MSADGSITGNQVFSVDATKARKTVTYTAADGTEKSITFYYYMSESETNAGGDGS